MFREPATSGDGLFFSKSSPSLCRRGAAFCCSSAAVGDGAAFSDSFVIT